MGKTRLGLRLQIVLFSCLLVIFLAGSSVVNIVKTKQMRAGYEFALDSVIAKKNYLLSLDAELNRILLYELEFSITLDDSYHTRAMEYYENSRVILARLDELEQNSFNSLEIDEIRELRNNLSDMRDMVVSIRDRTVRKGLTQDEGLRGSFRDAAHELEGVINEYSSDRMMVEYLMMRRHEKDYLLRLDKKYLTSNDESAGNLRRLITGRFGSSETSRILLDTLDVYKGEFAKLVAINDEMDSLYEQRDLLLSQIESNVEDRLSNVETLLTEELDTIQGNMVRIRNLTLSVSAVAIAMAVVMTVMLVIRIGKPMALALRSVDYLARGDLTYGGVYDRNDEMGDIIGGINTASSALAALMREAIRVARESRKTSAALASGSEESQTAIVEIQANLKSIREMGGDLSGISGKTLEATEKIGGSVEKLDSLIEGLSAGIVETTAAIEQMIANIRNVSDISGKREATVNELLEKARENGEDIRKTSVLTEEITGLAQGIGKIIGVINGIAARTNLLAMNAAIEAAHAGDAGRGFAVVADEIRKLAKSSGANASQIGQMLGNITERIEMVAQSSHNSTASFEEIIKAIQSFTYSFSEIVNSMDEMNTGSGHVLEASENMKEELSAVAGMAGEISGETSAIHGETDRINGKIFQLTRGIEEITLALNDISDSSQMVADSARESREQMEKLHGEISRFKTDAGEPEES